MFLVEIDDPRFARSEFTCKNATEVQRVLSCEYNSLILEEYKNEFAQVRPQWRTLICEPNVGHLFSANEIVYSIQPYTPGKHSMVIDASEMMVEVYGLDSFTAVMNRFNTTMAQ